MSELTQVASGNVRPGGGYRAVQHSRLSSSGKTYHHGAKRFILANRLVGRQDIRHLLALEEINQLQDGTLFSILS